MDINYLIDSTTCRLKAARAAHDDKLASALSAELSLLESSQRTAHKPAKSQNKNKGKIAYEKNRKQRHLIC